MFYKVGLIFSLALCVLSEEDAKWVWRDGGRSSREDRVASPRYEIYEKDDLDYPGNGGGIGGAGGGSYPGGGGGSYPGGGGGSYPGGSYPGGGGGNYPGGGGPGFDFNRPPLRPNQRPFPRPPGLVDQGNFGPDRPGPGYYPQGEFPGDQQGFGGRPPFKRFDTCTCSERFNCKSPGISYGHCDAGKSYCCFNKYGGLDVEPAPSRPIHSPENGILVGPGHGSGGYGKPGYAGRPGLGRPPIRDQGILVGPGGPGSGISPIRDQGVLVGPGGPTGIIGRPHGGGFGRPENGVLVGPGGPYDRPYGQSYGRPGGFYGRSAGGDKKQ